MLCLVQLHHWDRQQRRLLPQRRQLTSHMVLLLQQQQQEARLRPHAPCVHGASLCGHQPLLRHQQLLEQQLWCLTCQAQAQQAPACPWASCRCWS
jgi:hypothetical protein